MKKRLAALVLTLSMMLALPVPAYAAGGMSNFSEKKDTYQGFADVADDAWYGTALKSCYEAKLMQGTSATTFNPLGSLTVAAAVVMAARVNWVYNGNPGEIPKGADSQPWYQPALDYALQQGILTKEDLPRLDFTRAVTRAEMAYLFAHALPETEQTAINTVTVLPDIMEMGIYGEAVFQLYRAGVLTGNDSYGTFYPNSTITRQAACAIIARLVVPAQRKTLTLYDKYLYETTTFAMPAGSISAYEGNSLTVTSADQQTVTYLDAITDPAYAGYSITAMTVDAVQTLLEQSFAATGLTAGSMTVATVRFGAVDAYRVVFDATDGTVQIPACAFLFIRESTMYFYFTMTADGAAVLASLADSVTVDGHAVSMKLN